MPVFHVEGKMSTFGGPDDHGMRVDEDLALVTKADLSNPKFAALFLPAPHPARPASDADSILRNIISLVAGNTGKRREIFSEIL